MTLSTIIPAVLNDLVEKRVWRTATPDNLPREADGTIKEFIIWTRVGGEDSEYVDQTMGDKSHARVQIDVRARSSIAADLLIKAARDRLLASDYTVGVYGSPVGTYDAARKLHGNFQQFSIWFPQ